MVFQKKIQIALNSDPVKLKSKTGFGTQQALNKCPSHMQFHASDSLDQLVPIIYVSKVFLPSTGLGGPFPLVPPSLSKPPLFPLQIPVMALPLSSLRQ